MSFSNQEAREWVEMLFELAEQQRRAKRCKCATCLTLGAFNQIVNDRDAKADRSSSPQKDGE